MKTFEKLGNYVIYIGRAHEDSFEYIREKSVGTLTLPSSIPTIMECLVVQYEDSIIDVLPLPTSTTLYECDGFTLLLTHENMITIQKIIEEETDYLKLSLSDFDKRLHVHREYMSQAYPIFVIEETESDFIEVHQLGMDLEEKTE